MLPDIHVALRALLQEEGQISPADADIRFDIPSRQWIDRLTRPTVNLFLYALQENLERRDNSFRTERKDGKAERRQKPRRIDLRYLVSAVAGDVDDEHRLLWRALHTLMKYQELPDRVLPEALQGLDPPLSARTAQPDEGDRLHNVWSALSVEPRAAFPYVLVAPLDLGLAITAPLVLSRTLRVARLGPGQADLDEAEGFRRIGGVLRDAAGQPLAGATVTPDGRAAGALTDAEGRFALARLPEGKVALRVRRPDGKEQTVSLAVPADSYDLTLP